MWLPEPAEERGPGHWAVTVRAGPIRRTATCGLGAPLGDGRQTRRRLVCRADPEPGSGQRALPSFEGSLLLRATAGDRMDLGLEATYEPPTGAIGASLGPARLHAMAEAAAARFLRDVADGIMRLTGR